ncbi:MAG: hypothetical protein JSU57_00520 [Candidatus Heimdallarchaeota archaeon]|nr:MAG: hypothetical protein JSU57_00520 [Candidatus Heimdallarchaeota archaeon]
MLILQNSDIILESAFQTPPTSLTDYDSLKKPSLKQQQIFNPKKTFLSKTNLTVRSYLGITPENTYNATVLSLNRTHWFIHCDYSFLSSDDLSFDSVVNRTSINHGYEAFNYWNWQGLPSNELEFWIDTTGFYNGSQFDLGFVIATISNDTIKMSKIDQEFNAWKISFTYNSIIYKIWYSADSGLFLCWKQDWGIPPIIWFNLTRAEIAQAPIDYDGPDLIQISHKNNSRLASNTLISFEFESRYGIDTIYHHWDTNKNSTVKIGFLDVILPAENGSHDIFILAFDNVGYYNFYHLIYITDDTLPGISLLTPRNNSKIKGSTQIQLLISSGNGTIFYQWDGGNLETIDENTFISVPNPELEISHTLNVSVKSPITESWANSRYIWIVDNSPPHLTYYFVNNSVIKGDVNIDIFSTEDINLEYKLENKYNKSAFIEADKNYTISYSYLENGTYRLELIAEDEAKNNNITILYFSIYTSSFDWKWSLEANSTRTLNIVDDYNDLWFRFTIASKNKQYFNLSVMSEDSTPSKTEAMEYAIELKCEEPEEIIFISLTLILPINASEFQVYQWKRWDVKSSQWLNITTTYNIVSNSWEATYEGYMPYFALINTGVMTSVKSITPGGGQIPSFEVIPTLLSLIIISLVIYRKKMSTNPLRYPGQNKNEL